MSPPPDEEASELQRLRLRVAELENAERLLAQEQTARSELKNVLERVTDAFVSLNEVWQYTYVSAKAAEIFGRKPEDLIGKHIWTVFPEGVGEKFHHAYYRAMAEQVPIFLEEYYAPWDRWYENRIYPSKNGLSIFFTDVTERRKAEENQARLVALTEETTDLVAFADADGMILHLNPAGRRMLGTRGGEGSPGNLLRFIPERLHRRYESEVLPVALREGVWRGESALLSEDGRETPVSQVLLLHKKPEGSTEFMSIIARDISPQKRQEAQLRESEARYRTLVQNAPEAVVVLDVESSRFVDSNDNAVRLFGTSREQLAKLGPLDLSPPTQADGRPSAESVAEKLDEAVRGGRPVFEWIHRNSRGMEFPCEVRLVRVPSASAVLVRGSILDISERKRAEEALRESEARFRQIAETIRDVFWIGTPDLAEILYVSPAFEEIWGRPRKELYRSAATWNQAIHPDDGGPALRAVSSSGRMDNTYRIIRPDGEIRWIRERAFPILDASGLAYRVVGVAEDVTDIKEAEAELRESRRQLEEALKNTQDRMVQPEEQVRGRFRLGPLVGKSAPMQGV